MTRRDLLKLPLAYPQFKTNDEVANDFWNDVNEYILAWNDAIGSIMKRTPNVKFCDRAEERFDKLRVNPMWMGSRRKTKR